MHALGLYVDGETLRVALLSRKKQAVEVELLRSFPLHTAPGENVKPLYMLEAVLAGKKASVVSGLDAGDVLLREVDFKLRSKREVLSVLPFQVEPLIPYPLEEAILLPFFEKRDQGMRVTLLATTQTQLKHHLDQMGALQVDPDLVSCTPAALFRTARLVYPEYKALYLFHLGAQKSIFAVVLDGKLILSHTLNMGLQHFVDHPQGFQKELDRLLAFAKKKLPALPEAFLLTGHIPTSFQELFAPHTVLPTEKIDLSYALSIGLALEGLFQDEKTVQFRRGGFTPAVHVKKRTRQLGVGVALCLLLAVAMGTSRLWILEHRKAALHAALQERGYDEENLVEAVFNWESALGSKKRSFPYFPSVPKVSDVLAWLSTHPQLISAEPGEKIDIRQVRYQLVKYPKIGEKIEPYQAKVELEFTATSPRLARTFHDALMEGGGLVDARQEIAWKANQQTYYTSFFLK